MTILLTPILALAGGLGFQAAGFFLGTSGLLACAVDRDRAQYLWSLWPILLIAFVSWAWASTLWSPYEAEFIGGNASLVFGIVITLLFIPLVILRLSDRAKNLLVWAVIGTGLLGVVLLLIDAVSGFGLSLWGDPVVAGEDPVQRRSDAEMNLGRGQVSYAVLLWPIIALLITRVKRGWMFALAAVLCLMVSAQFNNLSIVIPTLILAGIFAGLAYLRPKLGLLLAFALAIASVAFAPSLGVLSSLIDLELMRKLPLSWEHRLRMWAYSWELIQESPLFGHGFDSSRFYDDLKFRTPDGRDLTVMSMHPHNIGLQIWLEIGVIGVLLAVGLLVSLARMSLKICATSAQSFAIAGLVVTVATSGAVTIGVWQHWWWALIVLAVSLICLVPKKM